jgi:hypothetical protein
MITSSNDNETEGNKVGVWDIETCKPIATLDTGKVKVHWTLRKNL